MKDDKSVNEYYKKPENIKGLYFYLGIADFIISAVAVYFALTFYIVGLILSLITLISSVYIIAKEKSEAVIALVFISILALLISLFNLYVNVFVFG